MGFLSKLFRSRNYTNINGDELNRMVKANKNILILDVRTMEEFKTGHIPNAKNIPLQELDSKINTLGSYKDEEIIVYCKSGGRSSNASNILSKNGFNKVYNLDGGISSYKGKLK